MTHTVFASIRPSHCHPGSVSAQSHGITVPYLKPDQCWSPPSALATLWSRRFASLAQFQFSHLEKGNNPGSQSSTSKTHQARCLRIQLFSDFRQTTRTHTGHYITPHWSLRGTPQIEHNYFCNKSINIHMEWDEGTCSFKLTFITKFITKVFSLRGVPLWNLELRLWICTCPRSLRQGLHDLRYTQALWSAGLGTGGTEVHSMWQVPCPNPTISTGPFQTVFFDFPVHDPSPPWALPSPSLAAFFSHLLNRVSPDMYSHWVSFSTLETSNCKLLCELDFVFLRGPFKVS